MKGRKVVGRGKRECCSASCVRHVGAAIFGPHFSAGVAGRYS